MGCRHLSVWALAVQPQSDPSEQDYTPVVKNKLLSIPFSQWKQWTGSSVRSGGKVYPRGCVDIQVRPGTHMGSLMVLWHGAAVGQCGDMWPRVLGRFGEVSHKNLGSCPSTRLMRWGFGDQKAPFQWHHFIQSRVCNITLIIYIPMIKQTDQNHRAALTRTEKGFSHVTSDSFPT